MLGFAALSGLPSIAGCRGSRKAIQEVGTSDVAAELGGDLDLNGNDILNVSDIATSSDRASVRTPGSGDDAFEIRDAAAEEWSMRATEGSTDAPGPVEFNAPVRGAGGSGSEADSLRVRGPVDADALSIRSWDVEDVTEHGIEPGSGDDLGAFIQEHFNRQEPNESVVYYLPNGTYTWNTGVEAEEFGTFGLIGKPQARLKCTNPEMAYFIQVGLNEVGHADIFLARNLTFDITTPDVAASAMIPTVDEYIGIDNCRVEGEIDRVVTPYYSIHPTLLTKTGRGYVSVNMPDGTFYDPSLSEPEHPMGIAIERDHRGYLVIENTHVEGFINNGIYSAGHRGKVAIKNTTVRNCGAGNLRLGDGDYAYKCHVVNDDAEDRGYSYAALWVADADHAVADSIEITAEDRTPSELIRVNKDVDHCTLTNIDVTSRANQYICHFTGSDPDSGPIVASNWTIDDTGSAQSNAHLGRIDRPNVRIETWDVDVAPSGDGKRHGLVVDAPWIDIHNSTFQHSENGLSLLLDDGADYLRLRDNDFKSGQLYQYGGSTVEEAIVVDNRFLDGVSLSGDQVDWTTRGQNF